MHAYGVKLCAINSDKIDNERTAEYVKGVAVQELAKDLLQKVEQQDLNAENFQAFSDACVEKLDSQRDMLKEHRTSWKPIVANILIALT